MRVASSNSRSIGASAENIFCWNGCSQGGQRADAERKVGFKIWEVRGRGDVWPTVTLLQLLPVRAVGASSDGPTPLR